MLSCDLLLNQGVTVAVKPKYVFPKTMGACADKLFETKARRLAMQKEVDAIEDEEKALKEHIINTLPKSDTGAAGKLARVTVVNKTLAQVTDWPAFYAYIKKTNQFDLMQRRVSDTAVFERWDNKKEVPGVGKMTVTSVSLNKI